MSKPKLLLISAISPFPVTSGGAKRVLEELKTYSQYFEMTLITWSDLPAEILQNELKNLVAHLEVFPLQRPNLFSFLWGIPFRFSPWMHPGVVPKIAQLCTHSSFDVVQIEFAQLLWLYSALPKKLLAKTLYVAHEITSISFYRLAQSFHGSAGKKLWHFWNWLQIALFENYWLPKFPYVIAVSHIDRQWLQSKVRHVELVENGCDAFHAVAHPKNQSIGFLGSISHWPNKQALQTLCTELFPQLLQEVPHAQLKIASNSTSELFPILQSAPQAVQSRIISVGYVENLSEFFSQIDLLVAPLQSGSGTRVKLLDAVSTGTPVVASTIAAEGLDLQALPLVSIADSPQEWLSAVKMSLQHTTTSARLKEQETLCQQLTWQHQFEQSLMHLFGIASQ